MEKRPHKIEYIVSLYPIIWHKNIKIIIKSNITEKKKKPLIFLGDDYIRVRLQTIKISQST